MPQASHAERTLVIPRLRRTALRTESAGAGQMRCLLFPLLVSPDWPVGGIFQVEGNNLGFCAMLQEAVEAGARFTPDAIPDVQPSAAECRH